MISKSMCDAIMDINKLASVLYIIMQVAILEN